jgi:hypothetical protein
MWVSAVIMQDRPVLHHIVKSKKEADVFLEATLKKEGLVCAILDHVVVSGQCVKRRARFTWGVFCSASLVSLLMSAKLRTTPLQSKLSSGTQIVPM